MLPQFSRRVRKKAPVVTACQSRFDTWQNCGENCSGSYWRTFERQCSHWSQSVRVHEEKVLFDELNLFYDKFTHLVDQEKPVNVISLGFRKASNSVSCSFLLNKMPSIQLDKIIMQWVNSWLMGWAQRVIVNGITSGCRLVTDGVPDYIWFLIAEALMPLQSVMWLWLSVHVTLLLL